jgi:hypothetical protein
MAIYANCSSCRFGCANGSFGPDEIEVMTTAYEATLIEVPVADRNDPMTELIAKAIVT